MNKISEKIWYDGESASPTRSYVVGHAEEYVPARLVEERDAKIAKLEADNKRLRASVNAYMTITEGSLLICSYHAHGGVPDPECWVCNIVKRRNERIEELEQALEEACEISGIHLASDGESVADGMESHAFWHCKPTLAAWLRKRGYTG
jgi:hypothetical protein